MSSTKISTTAVPFEIKEWVKSQLFGKAIRKWTLNDEGFLDLGDGIPWHEADREYYTVFKLMMKGKVLHAEPTEFNFSNSGMNEPHAYAERTHGKTEIPEGFVIVKCGTYPERACIYTAKNKTLQIEMKV